MASVLHFFLSPGRNREKRRLRYNLLGCHLAPQDRVSARPLRSRAAPAYGLLDLADLRRIAGSTLEMPAFAIDADAAPGRQTQLERGPTAELGHRLAALGFVHEFFRF